MDARQVLDTYDEEYARTYNDKFILSRSNKRKSEFEVALLKELLAPGGPWLDVACGTGYFLSRFPGVARAGLDISPAMLAAARQANPDALFFREGDFKTEVPEWEGRWSLVTCMWYAYGMVESIGAVKSLIGNLARWTSTDGACFVPVFEPKHVAHWVRIPYRPRSIEAPPGTLLISSVTWTWIEDSGKRHDDMVAPQLEYMVAMFKEHFDVVDVVAYPPSWRWGRIRRKGIIARAKKRRP